MKNLILILAAIAAALSVTQCVFITKCEHDDMSPHVFSDRVSINAMDLDGRGFVTTICYTVRYRGAETSLYKSICRQTAEDAVFNYFHSHHYSDHFESVGQSSAQGIIAQDFVDMVSYRLIYSDLLDDISAKAAIELVI